MNKEEREKQILENTGLVGHCIKAYFPNMIKRCSYEELSSAGTEGLIRAVDAYNPEKGKFSTYACRAIHNAIKRYLIGDRLIRVPEYKNVEMVALSHLLEILPDADVVDVANELDWPVEKAKENMDIYRITHVASFSEKPDSSDGDDKEVEYEDILNSDLPTISDEYETEDIARDILNVIENNFGEQTRYVIEKYYGIGCSSMSLTALAKTMGTTVETVRTIKNSVRMDKLDNERRVLFKLGLKRAGLAMYN